MYKQQYEEKLNRLKQQGNIKPLHFYEKNVLYKEYELCELCDRLSYEFVNITNELKTKFITMVKDKNERVKIPKRNFVLTLEG